MRVSRLGESLVWVLEILLGINHPNQLAYVVLFTKLFFFFPILCLCKKTTIHHVCLRIQVRSPGLVAGVFTHTAQISCSSIHYDFFIIILFLTVL